MDDEQLEQAREQAALWHGFVRVALVVVILGFLASLVLVVMTVRQLAFHGGSLGDATQAVLSLGLFTLGLVELTSRQAERWRSKVADELERRRSFL